MVTNELLRMGQETRHSEARAAAKKEQGGSEAVSEDQGEDDPLEDEDLIRMEPSTSEEPEDFDDETQNGSDLGEQTGASGLGTSTGPGAKSRGLPRSPVHPPHIPLIQLLTNTLG